jgi:hypothetical protein
MRRTVAFLIVNIIFTALSLGAESNDESDKLKNIVAISSDESSGKTAVVGSDSAEETIPARTPNPIEIKSQPTPTMPGEMIFSLVAGEYVNRINVESSYIDLGADIDSGTGSLEASGSVSFPVAGPAWINIKTEIDSVSPSTLFVSETGLKIKLGNINAGIGASFAPSFKFAGGGIWCVIRDAFYIVDKSVSDLYAEKKLSAEEFREKSLTNSFGLPYFEARLYYRDPLLTDSLQFGLDKIKFETLSEWKLDSILVAIETDFTFDFSDYKMAQGIGITTKYFNLITLFTTWNAERGVCIPPEVSIVFEYTLPIEQPSYPLATVPPEKAEK